MDVSFTMIMISFSEYDESTRCVILSWSNSELAMMGLALNFVTPPPVLFTWSFGFIVLVPNSGTKILIYSEHVKNGNAEFIKESEGSGDRCLDFFSCKGG